MAVNQTFQLFPHSWLTGLAALGEFLTPEAEYLRPWTRTCLHPRQRFHRASPASPRAFLAPSLPRSEPHSRCCRGAAWGINRPRACALLLEQGPGCTPGGGTSIRSTNVHQTRITYQTLCWCRTPAVNPTKSLLSQSPGGREQETVKDNVCVHHLYSQQHYSY